MSENIVRERKIEYIAKGNGSYLVKLSTAYDNNCSEEDYAEVSDDILSLMLESEKNIASAYRHMRSNEVSCRFDNDDGISLNIVEISAEEKYFAENDEQQIRRVSKVISQLSEKQRRRLYMMYCMEMSYSEIGRLEGKAPATIRESCHRALETLRKYKNILDKTTIKSWTDLLK